MAGSFDLTGKRALVTGANTGIGQAIAVALAGAGADVALAGRSAPDDTLALIAAQGRKAVGLRADLSSTAPIKALVDKAVVALGGLDILVNNAGIIRRDDLLDFSEEDWDAVIDTNLKSLFFLSQAAARVMAAQGQGKIINIASLPSFQGGIRVPSYAAAKSGVAELTRVVANGLSPRACRSTPSPRAISPPTTPPHCRPTRRATARSWSAFSPDDGARPRTSPGRRCSWPRPRRTMPPGISSRPTAAGWRGNLRA
jgi:2-deoxy-D-gluconate 3-dehydrogenase